MSQSLLAPPRRLEKSWIRGVTHSGAPDKISGHKIYFL